MNSLSSNGHLLVQLGRLSQVGRALEVRDLEDIGATFTGGRDDLWRVDLDEALLGQRVAEQLANSGL